VRPFQNTQIIANRFKGLKANDHLKIFRQLFFQKSVKENVFFPKTEYTEYLKTVQSMI
jgi:hypothetical protein